MALDGRRADFVFEGDLAQARAGLDALEDPGEKGGFVEPVVRFEGLGTERAATVQTPVAPDSPGQAMESLEESEPDPHPTLSGEMLFAPGIGTKRRLPGIHAPIPVQLSC